MLGFAANIFYAQSNAPASAGVYTTEQARRGNTLYQAQCVSCHSDDLQGSGMTPPLAGDDFMANWSGRPVAALFDKVQKTMPADHPGSLTRPQTADLVAFLLSSNNFPAGKTELPTDPGSLKQILIDKAPPKN